MSSTGEKGSTSELRARLAELEQQLAAAERVDGTHKDTEVGLREALAYSESIVDTVREPLLVLDGTLRVRTASHSFYQTFGLSPEETIGQFVYDLGQGQWNIPALRTLLEEVLPQDKAFRDFEVVHEFSSRGRRVMLLNGRKLWREGNPSEGVLLAIEDVTGRKQIEEELVRSNEDLQRFAYVAAHDLRSPLNSGLRLLQMLARRVQSTLDEEDANTLDLAIANFQRLGALMQDILSYSETGNAPQRRVMVSLTEPLQIALANLQHHIQEGGATVSIGDLPEVRAARPEGSHWRLSVRDNGEGFKPEYASAIFEPFKRLHGPTVPGSGIGLATCKRVIERLGGRIWAESIPGQGSAFSFTLPNGETL